jgi:hypothetical protein
MQTTVGTTEKMSLFHLELSLFWVETQLSKTIVVYQNATKLSSPSLKVGPCQASNENLASLYWYLLANNGFHAALSASF